MTDEEFYAEHKRIIIENNLGFEWNCDYEAIATGLNYYRKAEGDKEDEFSEYFFTMTGINPIHGTVDNQKYIDLLKKSIIEHS